MYRVKHSSPRMFVLALGAGLGLAFVAPTPVAAQTIVRITVQPTTIDLALDETVLLRAIATFSDTSTADISELVEWRSSNGAVVRVSNTGGSKGRTTARAGGHASISVRDPVSGVTSGQSGGSCEVQVLGKLKAISVTPVDRKIEVGQTRSFIATGTFSSGATREITEQVSWASSNPGVATVSNEPGQRGRVTAVAPGVTQITATSSAGVTSAAARVRVPSTLVKLSLSPSTSRVPIGLTVTLDAIGTFSDGTEEDVVRRRHVDLERPDGRVGERRGRQQGRGDGHQRGDDPHQRHRPGHAGSPRRPRAVTRWSRSRAASSH